MNLRYESSLSSLLDLTKHWKEKKDHAAVIRHITAILNAASSKIPSAVTSQKILEMIEGLVQELHTEKHIHSLQATAWLEKALRLAKKRNFKSVYISLNTLYKNYASQLVFDGINPDNDQTKHETDHSAQKKEQNNRYRILLEQLIPLLYKQTLKAEDALTVVEDLFRLISSLVNSRQRPEAKQRLANAIQFCKDYSFPKFEQKFNLLQNQFFTNNQSNVSPVQNAQVNNRRNRRYYRHEKNQLPVAQQQQSTLVKPGSNDSSLIPTGLDKELILLILEFSDPERIFPKKIAESLDIMHSVTKQFLVNKDIGLAYRYLEKAIILADRFNLSDKKNTLSLAQGDLLAQASGTSDGQDKFPAFGQVTGSLKNYLATYLDAIKKSDQQALNKASYKITRLETRFYHHNLKKWIVRQFINQKNPIRTFPAIFNSMQELTNRLIAFGHAERGKKSNKVNYFEKAWDLYMSAQPILTQSSNNWHEKITIHLLSISQHKAGQAKPLPIPVGYWQNHRQKLKQYRDKFKQSMISGPFLSAQRQYTKDNITLFALCADKKKFYIGSEFTKYICFYSLGSTVRLELCPGSDLEFLLAAIEAQYAVIGDYNDPDVTMVTSLYYTLEFDYTLIDHIRGLRWDDKGNPRVFPDEFSGTPKKLLIKNHPSTPTVSNNSDQMRSTLNIGLLYGPAWMVNKFLALLEVKLKEPISERDPRIWEDALAKDFLDLHIKQSKKYDFTKKSTTISPYILPKAPGLLDFLKMLDIKNLAINIKKSFLGPIMYPTENLGLHYRMLFTNTNDFSILLEKMGKLDSVFARAIRIGFMQALKIRVEMHFHYGEQEDRGIPPGVIKPGVTILSAAQLFRLLFADAPLPPDVEAEAGTSFYAVTRDQFSQLLQSFRQYSSRQDQLTSAAFEIKQDVFQFTQKQYTFLELCSWGVVTPLRHLLIDLKNENTHLIKNPLLALVANAEKENQPQALNTAMKSVFSAFSLAKAQVKEYRRFYLNLSKSARKSFKTEIDTMTAHLSAETIQEIKKTCMTCPLPNGIREKSVKDKKEWNNLLENLLSNTSDDNVTIKWKSNGKIREGYLHTKVVSHLKKIGVIDAQGKFQLTKTQIKSTPGRHMAEPIDVTINGQKIQVFFKIFPEIPAMELAVEVLTALIAGFGTPLFKIARLTIAGEPIVLLMSQTIKGIPMNVGIQEHGEKLNTMLDFVRFCWRVILALLLNQEDAKPSNFILREFINQLGKKVLEMICVDGDHSFFKELLEENGELIWILKDITFSILKLLKKKIEPEVVEEVSTLDPKQVTETWIDNLETILTDIDDLFTDTEKKRFGSKEDYYTRLRNKWDKTINDLAINKSILTLPLPEYTESTVFKKLSRMQDFLKENPGCTLEQLIFHMSPYLKFQIKQLSQYSTIEERFKKGFGPFYGTNLEKNGSLPTQKNVYLTLKTLYGLPQNAKEGLEFYNFSPKKSRENLEKTCSIQNTWKMIVKGIYAGSETSIEEFKVLPDMELRQTIINHINFAKLPNDTVRKNLTKALVESNSEFKILKLINCPLNDSQLKRLLSSTPQLIKLLQEGCTNLTEESLNIISEKCPLLEGYFCNGSPISIVNNLSWRIPKIYSPSKRKAKAASEWTAADFSRNPHLVKVNLNAPKLISFKALGCEKFTGGKLLSPLLRYLDLSNCTSLTTEQLAGFVSHFPYLEKVSLQGCVNIPKREQYELYPYLLRKNLNVLTDTYINQLTTMLEKFKNRTKSKAQVTQLLNGLSVYFDAIEKWMPTLKENLSHSSAEIKETAFLILPTVGRNDKQILQKLNKGLQSNRQTLQAAAAMTLCHYGNDDEQTKMHLNYVFASTNLAVIVKVIPLFIKYKTIDETEDTFISVLKQGSQQQGTLVLKAFAQWPRVSEKIVSTLQTIILNSKSKLYKALSFYAYWQLSKNKAEHKETLLLWLKAKSPDLQSSMPEILFVLSQHYPKIAYEIRGYLKKTLPQIPIQLSPQTTKQNLDDWQQRVQTIDTIRNRQMLIKEQFDYLKTILTKDPIYQVRLAAIKALSCMPVTPQQCDIMEQTLCYSLNDTQWQVAKTAAQGLMSRQVTLDSTIATLCKRLNHDKAEVRAACLSALETVERFHPKLINTVITRSAKEQYTPVKCAMLRLLDKQLSLELLQGWLDAKLNVANKQPRVKPKRKPQIRPTNPARVKPAFRLGQRSRQQPRVRRNFSTAHPRAKQTMWQKQEKKRHSADTAYIGGRHKPDSTQSTTRQKK